MNETQFNIQDLLANIGFKDVQTQELRLQVRQLAKTIESLQIELAELKPKKKTGSKNGRNIKGSVPESKT